MRRNPTEWSLFKTPLPPFSRHVEFDRQQTMTARLLTVLDEQPSKVWRDGASMLMAADEYVYAIEVARYVFVKSPRFDVAVSCGAVIKGQYEEAARVGQLALTIRSLSPQHVFWNVRPFERSLEGDEALRAMGMRWLLECQRCALRLRDLAAERGVRL